MVPGWPGAGTASRARALALADPRVGSANERDDWPVIDVGTSREYGNSEFLRKEVIQPHLPVRLPCYDFTPIANPTFDGSLHKGWATGFGCYQLSWCDGRCVQGPGTYSPQRADLRLLATPTSRSRVADCDPN